MSNNNTTQNFVVSIEGNIGVGKSVLLNILKDYFDHSSVCFKKEPVHKWINVNANVGCEFNLLDSFYSDTQRWSFATQVRCTTTRIQEYEKINKPVAFCERSWYTDRFVFSEALYKLGLIEPLEKTIYDDFYKWITAKTSDIDALIYLRASPDVCFSRSMNKNKHEQVGVSFQYLEKLHEIHEDWLMKNLSGISSDIPILVIDVEEDFEEIEPRQHDILNQIISKFPALEKHKNGNITQHHPQQTDTTNIKTTRGNKPAWSVVKNKKQSSKKVYTQKKK